MLCYQKRQKKNKFFIFYASRIKFNLIKTNFDLNIRKRKIIFDEGLIENSNYSIKVPDLRDLALNKIEGYEKQFKAIKGDIIEDTGPPNVEKVWQEDGYIIVKFTEDIKEESVNQSSIILKRNEQIVLGISQLIGARIISFNPENPLIEGGLYTMGLDPSIKDKKDKEIGYFNISFTYQNLPVMFLHLEVEEDREQLIISMYGNRYLFQGREYDIGLNSYYFRNRWFDNEIKVWTTPDPEGYKDSYNLYQPFGLDYANNVDPHGKHIILAFYGLGAEYNPSCFDEGEYQIRNKIAELSRQKNKEFAEYVINYAGTFFPSKKDEELFKKSKEKKIKDIIKFIHISGVSNDFKPAEVELDKLLSQNYINGEKIFIFGHSLGAIRAIKFSNVLARKGVDISFLALIDPSLSGLKSIFFNPFYQYISGLRLPGNVKKAILFYQDIMPPYGINNLIGESGATIEVLRVEEKHTEIDSSTIVINSVSRKIFEEMQ